MFGFEKIGLNFSFNYIYLISGIIILAAYSFYVYSYTLPPVSNFKRYFLLLLRSLALILLLFIFFEPVLTLTKKKILIPTNLFFIDNSRSMKIEDKSNRVSTIENLIDKITSNSLSVNTDYYSFGSKVNLTSKDSLRQLNPQLILLLFSIQ
jgi:hypothetical protein